jgi:prolyl 4-hydroxylase
MAYCQALNHLRLGQWAAARDQLLKAAGWGYAAAIKELGILELHGIACEADAISAVNRFQQSLTEPESQFEFSRCLYFGYGTGQDRQASLHWLKAAAMAGYGEALRVLAMLAQWQEQDRLPSSTPSHASIESLACALMAAAAAVGDPFACHLQSSRLLPDRKIDALDATQVEAIQWPQHHPRAGQRLAGSPAITLYQQVLTPWQCEYIRFRGQPHLRRSMVLNPANGERMLDPVRNSDSAAFDWFLEDVVVNQIMQAVTTLAGIDAQRSEPLHLLRYGPGQEYKPHYDFVGGLENTGQFADRQRTDTFCLYLNNVAAGGETAFPRLNLKIPARAGQVVHFENVDANGTPFIDSLHCGLPVKAGEKWLATLWIRKHDTQRGMNYESA